MKRARLYRWCTKLDEKNGYVLNSGEKATLPITQAIEEIVSHELNATTERAVFYSFSTNLELVKAYSERNPQGTGIMYVDIDLDALPNSVISLFPVYDRNFMLRLLASDNQTLKNGFVTNPATKRKHSLVGILNYSERSICGWANAMSEVMIQCNELKLRRIEDLDTEVTEEETNESLDQYMKEKFILGDNNIKTLRENVSGTFEKTTLKNRTLLNQVKQDKWCA